MTEFRIKFVFLILINDFKNKGFCHITFNDLYTATHVLKKMREFTFNGRKLKIDYATKGAKLHEYVNKEKPSLFTKNNICI